MSHRPTLARFTIGVMGSGSQDHLELAEPLGKMLAQLDVNLLTGGGSGVMRAVSRAFTGHEGRRGICIGGVIPCASETDRVTPKAGYPNEFVELAIRTHLPKSGREGTDDLSRNHINILTCAAIVALPGELGTASEVAVALRYGKPIIAYTSSPERLTHFAHGVERTTSIDRVRAFLLEYLQRTPQDARRS